MEIEKVPQDNISTFDNNKKAMYAVDKEGKVKVVSSSGWSVEEIVTKQALEDLYEHEKSAYHEVQEGKKSPLFYHMYAQRMDLQLLADATGFFQWSIKRDFQPQRFAKLKEKRLQVYAEALGLSIQELKTVNEREYE